jgi:4-carboxymuconolactone decarboxylase
MTEHTEAAISDATREALASLALGDPDSLAAGLELRADWQARSGLDARSFALVKIAALIAIDAPPASYLWQVANALDAGVTPEDILGVLIAIAPEVGGPRLVAAAPEIMVALGLSLPDEPETLPSVDAAAAAGRPRFVERVLNDFVQNTGAPVPDEVRDYILDRVLAPDTEWERGRASGELNAEETYQVLSDALRLVRSTHGNQFPSLDEVNRLFHQRIEASCWFPFLFC